MALEFTGRKRIRKVFGSIGDVAEMPNLIEVQKASYDQFLMVEEAKGGRPDEGLQAVFKSVFPISDFSNTSLLEFVRYDFDPPKYDVDECRQRGITFSAPLKVTLLVFSGASIMCVASAIDPLRAANRITVSDAVREALGDAYAFIDPDLIEVKGKGETRVWTLEAVRGRR